MVDYLVQRRATSTHGEEVIVMEDYSDIHEARAALELAMATDEYICCQRYINLYFRIMSRCRRAS